MLAPFDPLSVRNEFPVTERNLYLDSAHQSPLPTSVRKAIEAFLVEGNEMAGPKPLWMNRAEAVRERVAALVNASPDEIAFTKNTSEGLNIAANAIPLQSGDNVLMIEGDHPNNAFAWLNLRHKGVEVRFVPLADAQAATAETFAPFIDARTRAISMSHVTFHAGQRHAVLEIGRLCADRDIYFVVDAMQSVGVLPIDVKDMGISVLAAGCHKGLLVPQGLGILYVKAGLQALQPVYLGMSSLANPSADYIARHADLVTREDAGRFEMGNYNLLGLHALSASLDLLGGCGIARIQAHVLHLGDHLIDRLDELGVQLVGPLGRAERAHIYVLRLPEPEWAAYFARHQVRVSPERGGIRISFGIFNTLEDVDRLVQLIRQRPATLSLA